MKKRPAVPYFIVLIYGIFVILGILAIAYFEKELSNPANKSIPDRSSAQSGQTSTTAAIPSGKTVDCSVPDTQRISNAKEISLTVNDTSFTPAVITANQGDVLKITLTNAEGYHNFTIDNYGVYSRHLFTDDRETFILAACASGRYRFYSDDKKYKDSNIEGILIVN